MAALPLPQALEDMEAASAPGEETSSTSPASGQIYPEPDIPRPPRAKPICLGTSHAQPFPFYHLLSLCPPLDWEEHGFLMAPALCTLRSEGERCRGICCKALLIAYICYTPGSNPACSDTGSAHTAHVIFYMQTLLCSRSLTHWHPLSLAIPRGAFDIFFFPPSIFRKAKAEQRFPTWTFRASRAPGLRGSTTKRQ